ncbi:hypothetical protein BJ508DRAFT_347163 [Ascobolus immersus RN42]|uniref:Uncharacterized protein n=1 Tax=Ascobolus immersus RN42 TaxID=1160509 RepID=A0A3N4IFF3_ASCIM|nr:hypothetical protein BJ508DRAFT_347163 [Ascobolus immersus RN42]
MRPPQRKRKAPKLSTDIDEASASNQHTINRNRARDQRLGETKQLLLNHIRTSIPAIRDDITSINQVSIEPAPPGGASTRLYRWEVDGPYVFPVLKGGRLKELGKYTVEEHNSLREAVRDGALWAVLAGEDSGRGVSQVDSPARTIKRNRLSGTRTPILESTREGSAEADDQPEIAGMMAVEKERAKWDKERGTILDTQNKSLDLWTSERVFFTGGVEELKQKIKEKDDALEKLAEELKNRKRTLKRVKEEKRGVEKRLKQANDEIEKFKRLVRAGAIKVEDDSDG